ncbi:MAG: amidohydrolase family protein, partial [Dehalococcoidia bacterium]|nr:amidohydrolase family protein [Dehalococcoidia bacterium]
IELARGMDIFGRMLVANGVTSVLDATVTNDYDDWRILDDFCRSGSLKSRVSMMVSLEAMADFCECGTAMSALGAVRIGGVKVVLDEVDAGLSMKLDALENVLVTAHLAGYQIAVHAVEGQPLASAVNLLAKVMSKVPGKGHRHRIEHCALCPPEVRRQIKELGLIVVSQPGFIYQNGERYLQTVARGDIPDLYPFRSLVKEGVVVAAGSDSPVGVLSPVVGMYAAVTRRAENGQVVGIEQAVGPEVAIAMYTRDAAYATFGEFSFGTIAPGKRADMVVLSDNPLSCSCDQIKNIKVEMTLVEGRVVYEV